MKSVLVYDCNTENKQALIFILKKSVDLKILMIASNSSEMSTMAECDKHFIFHNGLNNKNSLIIGNLATNSFKKYLTTLLNDSLIWT